MRGKEFKRLKSMLGVVLLATFLVCTMVIPTAVTAERGTVPELSEFTITHEDLSEGDVINYDWYTPNGEELWFWIEDEGGNDYEYKVVSGSSGSFEVKSNGDWYVKWSNPENTNDVELEYDVSVESSQDGDTSDVIGDLIIIVVAICVIGGIGLYYIINDYKKQKELDELKESQQTQPQSQQQPQQYQQTQQQSPTQSQQPPPPPVQGSSTQQTQQQEGKPCPDCDRPMRFVQQYDRWYCDNCEKYQ